MVSTLPKVRVSPIEAQQGFTATCSCGWQIRRGIRQDADREAVDHRASHQTPLHEDDDSPWRMD